MSEADPKLNEKLPVAGSVTLEVKALKSAIGEADDVVERRNTIPILANVLLVLEPGSDSLGLRTTNLDMQLDLAVPIASADVPARHRFVTTISSQILRAIAGKLPADGQVTLAAKDGRLVLTSGRSVFTLATLPADEFPLFTADSWAAEFAMPAAAVAAMIDAIAFAASTEETRYYLNGIFLHPDQATLIAAATDGSRLARYHMPLPDGAAAIPKPGVIVPRRALAVIRKMMDQEIAAAGDAAEVAVALSESRIRIDCPAHGAVLDSKLIDGTFPDYKRVIPTGNTNRLKADSAGLADAIDRVAALASEKTRAVKVELDKDLVRLSVTSPENGTATEELPGDYAGAALAIGFNSRFLLDVIGRADADTLSIELGDAAAPVLVEASPAPEGETGQLYVIMPMRV